MFGISTFIARISNAAVPGAGQYTHVFDTAWHCQRANLTPRGAVHPIQICSLNVQYQPSQRSSAIYVPKIVPLLAFPRETFPSSLTQLPLSHCKSRPSIPSLIIISLHSIAASKKRRIHRRSRTDIPFSFQVVLENGQLVMKLPTH